MLQGDQPLITLDGRSKYQLQYNTDLENIIQCIENIIQ